jgi:hypothetical protein
MGVPRAVTRRQRIAVAILLAWTFGVCGLVLAAGWQSPTTRAVLGMAWGLILLWIVGCGALMWRGREAWR